MHAFDYIKEPLKCYTPDIVAMLAKLHEYKGRQDLFIEASRDELSSLLNIAAIQSTKASNRIEGIFTSDKRLNELVKDKSEPRNRSEREITGYRDVLATIHENYDYIVARPNLILQMHRDLYSYSASGIGGVFKVADNVISETSTDGTQRTRFVPVPAFQTREAIDQLCTAFNEAVEAGEIDTLLLVPMFVLDFLCIHPFHDGNGRMSRLLMLLLLYRAGYIVGKYISVEQLIEGSKETYYEVLQDGAVGWHANENTYLLFVRYFLGIMLKAYGSFEDRVNHLRYLNLSKPDRIREAIGRMTGAFTKRDILEYCPDIAQVTVERTLTELVKNGKIRKISSGPGTTYVREGSESNL